MKAEELRVGNLVWLHEIVTKVSLNNIEYHDRFEPIPLTEEGLRKLGFKKKRGCEFLLEEPEIEIQRFENHFSFYWFSETHIYFIHQLQNLYFALIGEELEIK